eukprot:TRINITY_DN7281_c0_g1_i3.p1 TRINITY_DN7281_c0_g1~~TRINITY_DN7281_c0_g1_i3.p1  ORF type:complete len:180 (+),score=23.13 TRINITY_DN7281_c0_g1_i3:123-662(+)
MISRVPISAADVAKLLETLGVDRVIAMDLHCGQIQGFFSPRVPVCNLDGSAVLLDYVINNTKLFTNPNKIVVVSPDAGGVGRARRFQERLIARGFTGAELAMIIKQRKAASQIERMDLVGHVEGKDCLVIDDMVDTAVSVGGMGRARYVRRRRSLRRMARRRFLSSPVTGCSPKMRIKR